MPEAEMILARAVVKIAKRACLARHCGRSGAPRARCPPCPLHDVAEVEDFLANPISSLD